MPRNQRRIAALGNKRSRASLQLAERPRRCGIPVEFEQLAIYNAEAIGAGHSFIVVLKDAFPINVMHAVKRVPEVCRIFCATANPVQVVAETEGGRGILGVIDGGTPKGIEGEADMAQRKELLRTIGYKG